MRTKARTSWIQEKSLLDPAEVKIALLFQHSSFIGALRHSNRIEARTEHREHLVGTLKTTELSPLSSARSSEQSLLLIAFYARFQI